MSQSVVFIGYDTHDEYEKNQLLVHLKAVRGISVWSDDQVQPGANWEAETNQAIVQAQVAILLISANFLGSPFLLEDIVPRLLKRQVEEGLIVLAVIARPCAWQTVTWLTEMLLRPVSRRP